MLEADARPMLSSIHVPTLVIHRTNYPLFRIEHGRYLVQHIGGARFVELPGADGALAWENTDLLVDEVAEFLTGVRHRAEADRALVTVLLTDIVASTERARELRDERWLAMLDVHDRMARRVVESFDGRLIKTTGDGILAAFDGPGRGIRAAALLREELRSTGLEIRAGLHTGEVELRDGDVGGIAVHIAARVMAAAGSGEILVSRTVRDLIAGSAIALEDRGSHRLKGVEGTWQLFAVEAVRWTRASSSEEMTAKPQMLWTFAITSIAVFLVTLDNLVVTTARGGPDLIVPVESGALSYWQTSRRVLGKMLGRASGCTGNGLSLPLQGIRSDWIAPRRSPVRVRLAPLKPPQLGFSCCMFRQRHGASECM
jgi:class 3 adenylate cyclase